MTEENNRTCLPLPLQQVTDNSSDSLSSSSSNQGTVTSVIINVIIKHKTQNITNTKDKLKGQASSSVFSIIYSDDQ